MEKSSSSNYIFTKFGEEDMKKLESEFDQTSIIPYKKALDIPEGSVNLFVCCFK